MEQQEDKKNATKEAEKNAVKEAKEAKKKKRRDECQSGSESDSPRSVASSTDEHQTMTSNNNGGHGCGDNGDMGSHGTFNSDLRSYLPKPMPSLHGTNELVKSLRAFYMLTWSRKTLRDLYGVTNAKVQDYSPNENQKVWDKVVHRRNVSCHSQVVVIKLLTNFLLFSN